MTRYVVGLTGGIATGKTNITDALKNAGACVVDADEISRSLTADDGKALPLIRSAFGNQVFSGESLNRKALGQLIFSDTEKRKTLNAIMHPLILQETWETVNQQNGIVFVSAPLLYELGMETKCQEVWCTFIPHEEQVKRLMQRDSISAADAEKKIASQMPAQEKMRRADLVINTLGTKEESASAALRAHLRLQAEKLQHQ
ncbi:MAG: dephospho-CoA kinase [Clostridia bacterium]|nr:dephospho-CoA kinase [Clostridia bacterium]